MLYTYASSFDEHNWIHEVIFNELIESMTRIDGRKSTIKWPNWIPQDFRSRLGGRTGLGKKVNSFRKSYRKLELEDRAAVKKAIYDQNNYPSIFQADSACIKLESLPKIIRAPSSDLAKFSFHLLSEYQTRDEQYKIIWSEAKDKICAFCGVTPLDHFSKPREHADHYLPKSQFPFCSSNLKNIAPMCGRCNTAYKKEKVVIYSDSSGNFRKASDPYSGPVFLIDLKSTPPYAGGTRHPDWKIDFTGSSEQAETWDDVFNIRSRYRDSVLNPSFSGWVQDFGIWGARCFGGNPNRLGIPSANDLLNLLTNYIEDEKVKGLNGFAFIKVAVFEYFLQQVQAGNAALADWLVSQISSRLKSRSDAA